MFWNVLVVEQSKLFRRKVFWIELALLAGLLALMGTMLYTNRDMVGTASITWPGGVEGMLKLVGSSNSSGLMVIVLAATVVAQEYTWRTLHLWLSNGTPRPVLLLAKFLALILPLFILVLGGLIVGMVLTAVFTIQLTGSLDPGSLDYGTLGLMALRTGYILLPYAAVTFLLSVVSRSAIVAIGGGVGFAMVESLAVQMGAAASGAVATVAQFLPAGLALSLVGQSNLTSAMTSDTKGIPIGAPLHLLDPTVAAIVVAGYVVVLVGLAIWFFRKQDLTA